MTNIHRQQKVQGIKCPNCNDFIPISIHQILYNDALICPVCGLYVDVRKNKNDRSRKALEQLHHTEH